LAQVVRAATFPYKFDQAKRKGFPRDILGGSDLHLKNLCRKKALGRIKTVIPVPQGAIKRSRSTPSPVQVRTVITTYGLVAEEDD
jgi:hypothetical protein